MKYSGPARFFLFLFAGTLLSISLMAQQKGEELLLVKRYAKLLQLPDDENSYMISNAYKDQSSGLTYIYIQQQYKGIKVFNQIITAAFKQEQLLYKSGSFIKNIDAKISSSFPLVDALTAVNKTAAHLQLSNPTGLQVVGDMMNLEKKVIISSGNIARQNIVANLYWVSVDDGATVHLSWNINIDVKGKADWWNVRIDALTGTILGQDNWSINEKLPESKKNSKGTGTNNNSFIADPSVNFATSVTGGSYTVVPFPAENKNVTAVAVDNNPWLKSGAGNNAITHGWHYDGTTDYNITRGNNVYAYLDVDATNTPGVNNTAALSTSAIPSLSFNFSPDFNLQPSDAGNKSFALTNLFYWNNLMHDVFYQYGFDEVSGNFQADNIGRGGAGNDYVQAEAQDGGGTNNANFATPSDGGKPRMQMYLFDGIINFKVNTPAAIAGNYNCLESSFSTANLLADVGPKTGQVVYYNDDASGAVHDACGGAPVNIIAGKIAMINRGNCNFTVKVKNAQDAGAIAVIMVNNVAGAPIIMGGTDNTITIPAAMISQNDGLVLATQVANNLNVTLSAGVNIDGDLDNGIVTHEYGHGISNRLTGGPANSSCLNNSEQAGEGWSDYIALMMTTNWATTVLTDGEKPRPVGTYAVGEPLTGSGIRRYPYSTNMAIDPLTYANMDGTATGGESHNIGEIWCSALWDMTWNIIKDAGTITPSIHTGNGTGGNVIALRLVIQGMKLQPCSPGFIDSRNAILAADSILYNYAHKCAIWKAFAARGMGYRAKQGSSNLTSDHTPAYDLPGGVTFAKNVTPEKISNSASYTINLQATCGCNVPLNNYKITDTIPAGFTYSSSPGGSVSGNVVTFSSINFISPQQVKNFSVTITATGTGCTVDSLINDNRETSTVGGLSSSALFAANNWTASSSFANSGTKAWFGADATDSSDFVLTSNAFTVQNLSILSFWHRYDFETGYDGGRIEISTDGGSTWNNAEQYIIQNSYSSSMNSGPWGNGEKVFSGSTGGQFVNTLMNLVPFTGQSVKIRFRVRTDTGNPATMAGWFIDDILALRGCGGFSKAMIFDNAGNKVDSVMKPLFITSVVTAVNDPVINSSSIRIYPNPASDNSNVSFHISTKGITTVSVVNLNGQKLFSYNRGTLIPGDYLQTIPVNKLAAGTYFISVETGNKKVYKKFVVVH